MIRIYIVLLFCLLPMSGHSLTLYQFWKETFRHDPRVDLYRDRLMVAAQSNPLALSKLLPHISFATEAQWNTHHITKPEDKYALYSPILSRNRNNLVGSWAAVLKQPVFNWASIQNYKASEFQVDAAADLYQNSMEHLEKKAIDVYISWLLAYANLRDLMIIKRNISKQAVDAVARFQYGTSGILAADEARVALGQINAKVQNAKAAYEAAAQKLKEYTGINPPSDAPPLPADFELKLPRSGEWIKKAQRHNPALSAAKYQLDALGKKVAVANAGFFPIVNLIVEHQWKTENGNLAYNLPAMAGSPSSFGSGVPDPHTYVGTSIMLELKLPIFSGGYQQAKLAQEQYRQESGFSTLLSIRRKTFRYIVTSLSYVAHSEKQAAILRRSLALAINATRKANEGVQAGLISENNALTDQRNELSVRNALNNSIALMITSFVNLNYAAGVLSPQVIANISNGLMVSACQRRGMCK